MLVRRMAETDVEAVADLCSQLGYPSAPTQVAGRFGMIDGDADQAVFVAEAADGAVIGWIHVLGRLFLESDPFAEIGGLVVDAGQRRRGVGRALLREAERWAQGHGYGELRVRSNTIRTEAHRFYSESGYTLSKTQHVFARPLLDKGV